MKKILFLLVVCIMPFFTYAENKKGKSNVTDTSYTYNSYNIIAVLNVKLDSVIYPYVINIPAPSETVIGISGPTLPNVRTWKVENGRLIITMYERDFDDLCSGVTSYIEVATNPMEYYAIQINVD